MAQQTKLPRVVLVGRMNVGKSSLFNRLSENVKSIALDYEGVTRDFLRDTVTWQNVSFDLVDSGGVSFKKAADPIIESVRRIALSLIDSADVVLFVTDGNAGVTAEDQAVARYLHKQNKDTILVVNKIDNQAQEEEVHEFNQLGFSSIVPLSAIHGKNINLLLEMIVGRVKNIPARLQDVTVAYKVALLGKPNVGKSSLMNLLLKEERSIVSDVPGTTREPLAAQLRFFQETLQLTDTPGIRRQRAVREPLEKLMVKTAFKAVDQADIVLLLVDGSEGRLSDQELKLAFYVFEQQKSLILLVNKDDLIEEQTLADWEFSTSEYEFFLKKIPTMFISCKTGKNVNRIMPMIQAVWQRAQQEIPEDKLTSLFLEALHKRPFYHSGELLRFYRARQIKSNPMVILILVNDPDAFGVSQCTFLESILRSKYDLLGVPVSFIRRKRDVENRKD